ncbi:hypothetical protein [Bradyrhizobium elkanii]|uniref:hypothetical protein n=1 Tax=Bradyrhizobium elkanii TaxID=29448 RepID=UPI00114CAEBF|nr:hypothetical protein [Bradyrhizobium elkanii]
MSEIAVYRADEREHGPPSGRRFWQVTLFSETGALLYEVKLSERLIYPAALERAARPPQRNAFRIIADPRGRRAAAPELEREDVGRRRAS